MSDCCRRDRDQRTLSHAASASAPASAGATATATATAAEEHTALESASALAWMKAALADDGLLQQEAGAISIDRQGTARFTAWQATRLIDSYVDIVAKKRGQRGGSMVAAVQEELMSNKPALVLSSDTDVSDSPIKVPVEAPPEAARSSLASQMSTAVFSWLQVNLPAAELQRNPIERVDIAFKNTMTTFGDREVVLAYEAYSRLVGIIFPQRVALCAAMNETLATIHKPRTNVHTHVSSTFVHGFTQEYLGNTPDRLLAYVKSCWDNFPMSANDKLTTSSRTLLSFRALGSGRAD